MRILLINVPHPAIGSRIPREQLPPLGLLSIGGPLIDAGHEVRLIDGEFGPMKREAIVEQALSYAPDAVLFGHTGSTSGHPIIMQVSKLVRALLPRVPIVYGGVHPTYFWREILASEPHIDVIVRGEGEETVVRLFEALQAHQSYAHIPGLAFRVESEVRATPAAPVIKDLDAHRVGWELIDHKRYSYWGGKRAVVIQFSRGCPHLCNYCGQRGFLDALAASRSEEAGGGNCASASRARRRGVQLRRRESECRAQVLARVPGSADCGEYRRHVDWLDASRRYRA
jgi:anaerobic magnesium-protoporphyrin IX monomethyl ester cyclase